MDNMYLQHMTPEEKAEYNRQYYQKHKYDIWGIKRGNSSGSPILGASAQRPKNVTGSTTLMSYKKLQPRQKNVTGKGSVDVIKPHGKYDTGAGTIKPLSTYITIPVTSYQASGRGDVLVSPRLVGRRRVSSSEFSRTMANNAKMRAEADRRNKTIYINNGPGQGYAVTSYGKATLVPVSSIKYSKIDEYKRRTKAHLDSFGKAWKSGANDLINAGKSIWNKLFG